MILELRFDTKNNSILGIVKIYKTDKLLDVCIMNRNIEGLRSKISNAIGVCITKPLNDIIVVGITIGDYNFSKLKITECFKFTKYITRFFTDKVRNIEDLIITLDDKKINN